MQTPWFWCIFSTWLFRSRAFLNRDCEEHSDIDAFSVKGSTPSRAVAKLCLSATLLCDSFKVIMLLALRGSYPYESNSWFYLKLLLKGLGWSTTSLSEKRPGSYFLGLVGILFGTFFWSILCKLSKLLLNFGIFILLKQPFYRFACSIGFRFNLSILSRSFFSTSIYLYFFSSSSYRYYYTRSASCLLRSFSSSSCFISAWSCISKFEFILRTSRWNPCATSVAF